MLNAAEMRQILNRVMTKDQEYDLHEIYDLVERHATLDKEDLAPSGPEKTEPRWHERVRSTLFAAHNKGEALNSRRGYHIRLKPLSSGSRKPARADNKGAGRQDGVKKQKLANRFDKVDRKLDVLNSDVLDIKADIRAIKVLQ